MVAEEIAERPRQPPQRLPWWHGEAIMATAVIGTALMIGFFSEESPIIKALAVDHVPLAMCRVGWMVILLGSGAAQMASLIVGKIHARRISASVNGLTMVLLAIKLLAAQFVTITLMFIVLLAFWESITFWALWDAGINARLRPTFSDAK